MRNTLLRVAYAGTQGRNLDEDVQLNGQPSNYVYYVETGKALPTGAFAPVALLRPGHLWQYSSLRKYRLLEL